MLSLLALSLAIWRVGLLYVLLFFIVFLIHLLKINATVESYIVVVPFAVVEQFRSRTNSNHSSPSHSKSNSPASKHAMKPLPSPTAPQLTPSNSIRPPPSYTQATQSTPSTASSSTSSHYGNLTVTPPSAPFETINSTAPVAFAAPGTYVSNVYSHLQWMKFCFSVVFQKKNRILSNNNLLAMVSFQRLLKLLIHLHF